MLNGEKLETFPLTSGTRQRCSLLTTPFQHCTVDNAIRQEKKIIGIHMGKEKIKLSLFTDDMMFMWKIQKN